MTSLVSGRCDASIYGLPPVQPLALSSVLTVESEDCVAPPTPAQTAAPSDGSIQVYS
jgi:hypothetical protein